MKIKKLFSIALGASAIVSSVQAKELTLAKDGKTDYKIVIAAKPAKQVKYAAEEMSKFLKEMTGADFKIVSDKEAKGKYEIVLGETNRNAEIPANLKVNVHEGFAVLRDGDSLQFRGKIPRGTLYGVYDFLDEKLGVRFLAFDYTHVPKKATVKVDVESYKYEPPFDYRNIISCGDGNHNGEQLEGIWQVRQRLNSVWGYIPLGSKIGGLKHLGGFVHNLHKLMPHKKYFKDHPEYFAYRGGARRAKQYPHGKFESLPCLTNPEVKEVIVTEIRRILKDYFKSRNADPDDQIFFPIDYHDHDQVCQCDKCEAVNKEEECPGGTLFRFLNAVAEDVCKDYPNVIFSTLAYAPTLKPGKTPLNKNIVIRYAPIRMDNARSLEDKESKVNTYQLECLQGWIKSGTPFYVWYYAGNFTNGITPHPDLAGIAMNFPVLTKNGMRGMFCESPQSAGIEMKELRSYIVSKYLWRPATTDIKKAVEEFCHLYYGKGGEKVLEYIKAIHDYHYKFVDAKRDTPLTLRGAPAYRHAYTPEFIDKMDKILYDAEKLAENDKFKLHVAVMHMPMWFLRLNNAMNTERRVAAFPVEWRFKIDPGKKVKPTDDTSKWGKVRIDDFWTKQEPYTEYRGTAWYAVDFTVDEKLRNQDLSFYFSAVDGTIEIYIDGELYGKKTDNAWNKGFYMHLTKRIAPGKHELKAKIYKDRSAAGIWQPVALLNMAQDLAPETRMAGERYMATDLKFLPKRRKMEFRKSTFEKIETLLSDNKAPITSLKDGVTTKMAHTLDNGHKTFAKVDDDTALTKKCAMQLPTKKWTLGQSMNYRISELEKDHKKLFRARVRIKVKKTSDIGDGAVISFCYYNKKGWSGGNCAPSLTVPLKNLPNNEWVWIEYPHILRYKEDIRYQILSVKSAYNPKNMQALYFDAIELTPVKPGDSIRLLASALPNAHKTFTVVDDNKSVAQRCAMQTANKNWTLGQSLNFPVSEFFDDDAKLKTYKARVRIKVSKKGNKGDAAIIGFDYYNLKNWSGDKCAPPLKIKLESLPDNEWVWIDYPHVLKYKENVRYQLISVKAANNPANLNALYVDAVELRLNDGKDK